MAVVARLIAALAWLAARRRWPWRRTPDGPFRWQMDFQTPATLVMEYIHWFSWYTRRSS